MPIVSLDGLSFPGLAWSFTLLASKHTNMSIWHARPFSNIFYRSAYSFI